MNFLFPSFESIGLEQVNKTIRVATIVWRQQKPFSLNLFLIEEESDVKQLYMDHPLLVTGLDGSEVLVRPLVIGLTKEKDIQEALAFQAEPLLPYPVDQALLNYQQIDQTEDSTHLTLIASRHEAINAHLEKWMTYQIEPEQVSCVPSALAEFSGFVLEDSQPIIVLHVEFDQIVGVLVKNKKLIASFAEREGLQQALNSQSIEKLQKQILKISHVLSSELLNQSLAGILLTGSIIQYSTIYSTIVQSLQWPQISLQDKLGVKALDLQLYAVPIGLSLNADTQKTNKVNFRLDQWSYPYPWHRLKQPLALCALALCLTTFLLYLFGQTYLQDQERMIKQSYVDLLANRNKTYDQFEIAFLEKNLEAKEKFNGEVVPVDFLSKEDLTNRLSFFQKEVQSVPETFPLFANTPRVSDVLAWLSQHPVISYVDEQGQKQARLKIENFNYTMVKRPVQNKKQEKYQVKIELELSSSTPKWAREFHDALITPNDMVDPKSEVKWSSNRGKYKTSFYLKDKTMYQSL